MKNNSRDFKTEKTNEPFIKLDGKVITKTDIENMDPLDITDILNRIPTAINDCSRFISNEKKNPKMKGKVLGATYAKKQLQLSMQWISAIRKRKNVEYNRNVNEYIREAAHQILDGDTFEKVMLRATALSEMK